MKGHRYWNFIGLLLVTCNLHGSAECSMCETCICTSTDSAWIVNCQGKRLEDNNHHRFDLLMFDEEPRLSVLNLAENGMNFLPTDMFTNLVNLETLNLSRNHLQEIPETAFDQLQSLTDLDLSHNNLTALPERIITKITKLQRLNLSQNQLSVLDPDLKLLTNLTWLDVSHNNIQSLENGSLQSLTQLEYLDLSFNRIDSLGENNVIHLTQLATLTLNNNHLVYLSPHEFPVSIINLNVGYNMITNVPETLINLQTLDMAYNEIVELNDNLLSLVRVESLNFSGNKLTDFPNVKLEKLDTLDLSFNKLSVVPETIKNENLPQLSTLVISGNPIRELKFNSKLNLHWLIARSLELVESIDEDALSNLDDEKSEGCLNLIISQNKRLTQIDANAFRDVNLCSLDLSSNNLSSISPGLIKLQNNTGLLKYSVNLQSNPFHCDCPLQWMLVELIPKLYDAYPQLLDDLKCASPPDRKDMRMIHWYKWKDQVFCEDSQILVSKVVVEAAGVMSQSSQTIKIESSTGMLAALIGAAVVLSMLVTIGIVSARRIAMKRSRRNRRF
ncbi:leucine-rich repeat neuronal protein 3-like [Diprion similis]|uniref:leucine-rich repeat neuronal protein 3-like n=1 Tax=Diprion similis TaxID=362088 RepID=UPI001EF86168|nr:leucine-rich repeat neuronal protein 3-like [Diprion similis]